MSFDGLSKSVKVDGLPALGAKTRRVFIGTPLRVGSAGGTEITQGFLSAAASIRYNSTIFGFHTPSSGPASYVLTAINATNADVVAVLNPTSGGVRLAAVEQPMA